MNFGAEWLAGGAAVALIGSMWGHIRMIWSYAVSMAIGNASFNLGAAQALVSYLNANHKMLGGGNPTICLRAVHMKSGRSPQRHFAEYTVGSKRIYLVGLSPVVIKFDSSQGTTSVMYLRWLLNLDDLIVKASVCFNNEYCREHFAKRMSGKSKKMMNGTPPGGPILNSETMCIGDRLITCSIGDVGINRDGIATIDWMSITDEAHSFVDFCRKWLSSREYYAKRMIPWKTGACFYGEPGTGKTALARAIGVELDIPVFIIDLATMENDELFDAWTEVTSKSPSIALFEDIDAVFHGRDPANENISVTFDSLLQCLSGVNEADGVISIVTTNKIETVDPALLRPGRAERKIHFPTLNESGVRKIATRILGDWPEEIERIVSEYNGKSGACVQAACVEIAMRRLAEMPQG